VENGPREVGRCKAGLLSEPAGSVATASATPVDQLFRSNFPASFQRTSSSSRFQISRPHPFLRPSRSLRPHLEVLYGHALHATWASPMLRGKLKVAQTSGRQNIVARSSLRTAQSGARSVKVAGIRGLPGRGREQSDLSARELRGTRAKALGPVCQFTSRNPTTLPQPGQ